MNMQPFHKRELFLTGLVLDKVNLDAVARVVAGTLGLRENEVFVVDAREDLITLDILKDPVDISQIAGQQAALLQALAELPGLSLGPQARIHSEGVWGMLSLEPALAETLPESLASLEQNIQAHIARKVLIMPTGNELLAGQIEDTNTPFLCSLFRAEGFLADYDPPLPDDLDLAIGRLSQAAMRGYGLVVSTGGTGAEAKDCMVEAIMALDPAAAAPYVVHYQQNQGRHHKDGVRLAVGVWEHTTFIALTGPHKEVRLAAPVLLEGLKQNWPKHHLAQTLAAALRTQMHN